MTWSWKAGLLVAVGLIPVVLLPSTGVAWAWIFAVLALCCIDAFAAASPRDLSIERRVEGPIRADETTDSVVRVANPTSRSLRVDVRDAWPPSLRQSPSRHRLNMGPGDHATATTRLAPMRRGTRRADYVTLRVWGPMGLGARQVSIRADLSLSVLPEFRSRRLLPSRLARLNELEGTTATVLRGPGTEFDSLREYVRGDDPRDIDWKASARSKDLVVRTWRPERDRRVVIVLDSGRLGAALLGRPDEGDDADRIAIGSAPRLDSGIEAALLLGALANRAGDQTHLLAIDRQVRARVSGVRGDAFLEAAAQALSEVSASSEPIDWSLVVAEVSRTVRHPSLVVLATPVPPAGSDPEFLDAVAQLKARHTVMVASAQDPDIVRSLYSGQDADSVFRSAAAARSIAEDEAGRRDAERAGALVVSADAGLLPARTADAYLELKKAGRL
ncbi:DUF58 domain-containing protein [Schaalia vaccimaxillae]|uniref:DUF58 domain-containing protein n=1 Tax=Schaalia vaccimaxillae TaxID=183916 RepID=UPI0003B45B73|nr:DUF58 domain-containing protein [Schaalia vaccimaxillae]